MLGVSRSIGPYGYSEAVLFRRCFIEAWEPGWRIPCGLYPSRLSCYPAREWRLCRLCRYPGCYGKARQGLRARRKLRVAGRIANICNSDCASEVFPPVVPRGMTSVSYAVVPSNASQEYFSNISSMLRLWEGAERQAQTAQGAVLSVSDIRVSEAKRGRVPL